MGVNIHFNSWTNVALSAVVAAAKRVKVATESIGKNAKDYSGHSLCKGGASALDALDVLD